MYKYAVIANGVSRELHVSRHIPLTIFFQSTDQPSTRTIQEALSDLLSPSPV